MRGWVGRLPRADQGDVAPIGSQLTVGADEAIKPAGLRRRHEGHEVVADPIGAEQRRGVFHG